MKKAVILHGTDGNPEGNWFPWLKNELENRGYEVWVPLLPDNHMPNRSVYNDFLFSSGWDLNDNVVIGHSSGAVEVLNLLMDPRCPHIKAGVLVGIWESTADTPLDPQQFASLFPPSGFDYQLIKEKAGGLLFVHGQDDPYCPLEQAQWMAERTSSDIVIVPEGKHLGASFDRLPILLEALELRDLL